MAEGNIEGEYIYEELGFPIVLRNVSIIEIQGRKAPDINLPTLQNVVLLTLAHHPDDLTGKQIRFIRSFLKKSQVEFGKLLGVTHPAVVKWEKSAHKPVKMTLTTQRAMRLMLLDKLLTRDDDFRNAYRAIHSMEFSNKPFLLEFDAQKDL